MFVALFPGQGSQSPGFLTPWLELNGARERITAYSDWSDVDLISAGTEWDAEQIRDTQVAQPLIVAASLLSWHAFEGKDHIAGVAGHSVGEFAAAAAAGILTDEDAMRLVGIRGRAMAAAAREESTGMSAIIGGDPEQVAARLDALELSAANHNGAGQLVAAGSRAALDALAAEPPAGTRVVSLAVAGAFHTRYMESAAATLQYAASLVEPADPTRTIWSNHDASTVTSGARFVELLVGQVSSPVRWDLCMAAFAEKSVSGLIEFAPAGTLTGLAKRALRGTPTVALKSPDDLTAACTLVTGGAA